MARYAPKSSTVRKGKSTQKNTKHAINSGMYDTTVVSCQSYRVRYNNTSVHFDEGGSWRNISFFASNYLYFHSNISHKFQILDFKTLSFIFHLKYFFFVANGR